MTRLVGLDLDVPLAVALPVLLAVLAALALLLGRLAARLSRPWFQSLTRERNDGGLAPLAPPPISVPVALAVIMTGTLLMVPDLPLSARSDRWLRGAIMVLLVASCAMVVMRLAVAGVGEYTARRPSLAPALSVARMSVRIVVAILAIITGLQSLGVPVTPLLTTLGVGSLAVALALQDTLANFFAGLYLLADRPVRPGDYVKLMEGAEGYVDTIGWRSSRLRTPQGNTVIVPNQKLSQSILTNFHLPLPELVLVVPVTVSHEANADDVEAQLLDELKAATRTVPELTKLREPAVRLAELTQAGLVFHCVVHVESFEAQWRAGHELRKRVLARLKTMGITLGPPAPVAPSSAARPPAATT
jgi:small-conductance mechanosensitive channel